MRALKHSLLLTLAALSLLLSGCGSTQEFIASPWEPHALVITSQTQSGDNIYPLKIDRIDGQRITDRKTALWLTPGTHTLDGVDDDVLPRAFVPGLRLDQSFPNREPFEIDVEAGKVYYIGLKADGSRRADWKYVVWKVEDQKS